jgi:tRNA pseudouridine55 synthase
VHSAIKQKGRPVYHKARKGEAVELAPRKVVVHDVQIESVDLPYAAFRVHVSKGTYVRALARDLGSALGTGAVVTELRRECIASWSVKDALTVDEVVDIIRQ